MSMDEVLRRGDGKPVHHLHAGRDDAMRDHICDALPGSLDLGEADQQGARGLGLAQDADHDLRDDAEQALRACDHAHEVVALAVEMLAAQTDQLAADERDLEAE
jgi:hypothetical protein